MSRVIVSPAIQLASPDDTVLRVINQDAKAALVVSTGTAHKLVTGFYLSEIGRDQLLTALLDWRYTADELPDDEVRVICALDNKHTDEPAFGHVSAGRWWDDDNIALGQVYAWAHVPALPPKKGGAR